MTKKERNGSQTFLSVCVNVNCRQDLSFCVTFYASVNLPPSQAESVGFFNFLPSPLSLCCGEVLGGRECVERKTKSAKVEGTFLFFSRGIRRNVFVKL